MAALSFPAIAGDPKLFLSSFNKDVLCEVKHPSERSISSSDTPLPGSLLPTQAAAEPARPLRFPTPLLVDVTLDAEPLRKAALSALMVATHAFIQTASWQKEEIPSNLKAGKKLVFTRSQNEFLGLSATLESAHVSPLCSGLFYEFAFSKEELKLTFIFPSTRQQANVFEIWNRVQNFFHQIDPTLLRKEYASNGFGRAVEPIVAVKRDWIEKSMADLRKPENRETFALLSFAKQWLTKMSRNQVPIIKAFYPFNIGQREDKTFCILAPGRYYLQQIHLQELIKFIYGNRGWAGENQEIANFLIEDFPPGIKRMMEEDRKLHYRGPGDRAFIKAEQTGTQHIQRKVRFSQELPKINVYPDTIEAFNCRLYKELTPQERNAKIRSEDPPSDSGLPPCERRIYGLEKVKTAELKLQISAFVDEEAPS